MESGPTALSPGPIEGTEGMKRLANPALIEAMKETIPLKRLGTVEDIGHVAVFLASSLASYI